MGYSQKKFLGLMIVERCNYITFQYPKSKPLQLKRPSLPHSRFTAANDAQSSRPPQHRSDRQALGCGHCQAIG